MTQATMEQITKTRVKEQSNNVRVNIEGDNGKVFLIPHGAIGTDKVFDVSIVLAENNPRHAMELPVNNRDDVFWNWCDVATRTSPPFNGCEMNDIQEDALAFIGLVKTFVRSWYITWDRPNKRTVDTYDRTAYNNMVRFLI